jgi:hypothetical protein
MRSLGIGLIVLGLALAVYSYGVGIVAFIAGILAVGVGTWFLVRGGRVRG